MSGVLAWMLGHPARDLPAALRRQAQRKIVVDRRTPIEEVDFVALDTELTGLDPKRDTLISIGAVKLHGSRLFPGKVFYRLVRPESELRAESVVVHELAHSDLEDAERAADVLPDFIEFVADSVLLGHFVHIDLSFIHRTMKRIFGVGLRRSAIDTATLHDWLLDNDPEFAAHHGGISVKKDLFSAATRYGIEVSRTHNALFDAFVAAQLFQRFFSFLPSNGVKTVGELLEVARP